MDYSDTCPTTSRRWSVRIDSASGSFFLCSRIERLLICSLILSYEHHKLFCFQKSTNERFNSVEVVMLV
ncbi:hypothetical protein BD560DRAFT_406825 [Blakeslea trispora]|nr:hypothetical protein BD560DRAFT_406825 [Blakeslea trispora]